MMSRATLNDLGLGLVVGLLVALSPFTTPRLVESLIGGALATAAVLGYRRLARGRAPGEPGPAELGPAEITLPPLLIIVALGLFLMLFYPTLNWLLVRSTASVWTNGHGLFTPFIMGYLAVRTLKNFEGEPAEGSAWGFVFVGLGVSLLLLDLVPRTFYMATIGLILCLPGLSLIFFGVQRTRALALPLALGLFLIPIPHTMGQHLYLQTMSAAGAVPLLRLFGYAVLREDTMLQLGNVSVVVTEACSGFSALYAAIFLGVILVAYSPTTARKIGMALAVIPVAIFSNILRVIALVVLADIFGMGVLDTPIHPASGAVSFWVAMVALFLIAGRKTMRAVLA